MSVYKPKEKSEFYHYDFRIHGRRFHGSTGCKNRREAEAFEDAERQRVKAAGTTSVNLQMDHVTERYWNEIGQHHAGADNTFRDLARLVDYFTPTKLLSEVSDTDVARLVSWRRGHKRPRSAERISNATVNRSTTEVLKKLFTRAKDAWGVRFDHEPHWKQHRLKEPVERVRELHGDEAERLDEAMRADYAPFFAFAKASGLRLNECLLRWSEVDWSARRITKLGKGGKRVSVPITDAVREILWPLRGHNPAHVFTYVAERTRDGHVKGTRYPLTYSGVKIQWRRLRARAGVQDFRLHDFRHNLATKLLRETGNLKLVQRALNHSDIKTTTRYAHVLDDEVAAALETVAAKRSVQ